LLPALLILALFSAGCVGLGAAAAVGGIAYYRSSHHESATVNLNAPADKVYQVALETIAGNSAVQITRKDDKARLVEMVQDNREITLKVSQLSPTLSQLAVTSNVERDQPGSADAVLKGVARICDKLGVEHHVVK